ncbi:glycosyltransferase [Thermococcus thioreducens]|uniref:Glycosyl transferase n=1 Tax=Thermococcus thioreducens TaxID=277988 RepID=A0A0Q2S6T3_9EURY|nr:glycosyltransferase family 2 protein [Thermococcus thioreducens]ASJ12392.1 glycosyl transferase [Thermococcus thioreducens]KQH83123.1 glycosyl transferase [Thermococcus thioreducens]SEV91627.1 Glycosyltransferase, catalytic subunit of cellulose synthase and poly-beta-1,6-N-acetylglucosamine synthase [Thermococcus thioreducens]
MNPLLLGLFVILLWDGYFFFNYIISLFKNYRIREWSPKVSIIIPAYNEGERILRAIKSALAQDYPDFEVIVIDDGSKDNTFEVAFSVKDPRLRVYRKNHGGKAKALNFGLSKASGEIVVTTDADSRLEPDAVKELVRRFYSDEILGVGGQVRVAGESFLEIAQDAEHLRIAMFRRAKELDDLSLAPGPIAAFRREVLGRIGGFVEEIVEDYATTKAVKEFGKVVYAPRAKVWTEMPKSISVLWRQRKRWFLGDLKNLGGGFTKDWIFLILGDVVAFFDVIVPPLLLITGHFELFALWWFFETFTMLLPTLFEGGRLINTFLFPVIVWFWAAFYLALHIYGYLSVLLGRV